MRKIYEVYCASLCESSPDGVGAYGYAVLELGGRLEAGMDILPGPMTISVAELISAIEALKCAYLVAGTRSLTRFYTDSDHLYRRLIGHKKSKTLEHERLLKQARDLIHKFHPEIALVSASDNAIARELAARAFIQHHEMLVRPLLPEILPQLIPLNEPGHFSVGNRYLVDLTQGTCSCPAGLKAAEHPVRVRCEHMIAAELYR